MNLGQREMRRGNGGLWLPEHGIILPPGYRTRPDGRWAPPPAILPRLELAIARTTVVNNSFGAGTSQLTTAANYTANTLGLLDVFSAQTSAVVPTVSGAGRAWDQVATALSISGFIRVTRFRAVGPVQSSQQLTLSWGAQSQVASGAILEEFSGVNVGNNGAAAFRQTKTGAADATSILITFTDFATALDTSALYAFFINGNGAASTPRASWTEIIDSGGTETQIRNPSGNDTGGSLTAFGAQTNVVGIVSELIPAAFTVFLGRNRIHPALLTM